MRESYISFNIIFLIGFRYYCVFYFYFIHLTRNNSAVCAAFTLKANYNGMYEKDSGIKKYLNYFISRLIDENRIIEFHSYNYS